MNYKRASYDRYCVPLSLYLKGYNILLLSNRPENAVSSRSAFSLKGPLENLLGHSIYIDSSPRYGL